MTAAVLANNLPVLATKFDATNANSAQPALSQMNNGFIPNTDIIKAEDHNFLHGASTGLVWLMQQLGLFLPFNPVAGASVIATKKGGVVSLQNNSTGATEFYVAKVDMAIGYTDPSLDPTHWGIFDFNVLSTLSMATFYADAGGTVNARTGAYTIPYPVLLDGMQLTLDVPAANATTTPTFQPTLNGSLQTARTIVKSINGAVAALQVGDLLGKCQFIYDLPNTQWILQNPAISSFGIGQQIISVSSSRSAGTTYTNNTGRTIMVLVNSSYAGVSPWYLGGFVNGQYASQVYSPTISASIIAINFIVPPGGTYLVLTNGVISNSVGWYELL